MALPYLFSTLLIQDEEQKERGVKTESFRNAGEHRGYIAAKKVTPGTKGDRYQVHNPAWSTPQQT